MTIGSTTTARYSETVSDAVPLDTTLGFETGASNAPRGPYSASDLDKVYRRIAEYQHQIHELMDEMNRLDIESANVERDTDRLYRKIERIMDKQDRLRASIRGTIEKLEKKIRSIVSGINHSPATREGAFEDWIKFREAIVSYAENLSHIYPTESVRAPKERQLDELKSALNEHKGEWNEHKKSSATSQKNDKKKQQQDAKSERRRGTLIVGSGVTKKTYGLTYAHGVCDAYLDWLYSLSEADRRAAQSGPSVVRCTTQGVRKWQEKMQQREAAAREGLRQLREMQAREVQKQVGLRARCHRAPAWAENRVLEIPPGTDMTGPWAPLAVPFTVAEVQTAVANVVRAGNPYRSRAKATGAAVPSGCPGGVDASDVRIAEAVARDLERRHPGRGWVKLPRRLSLETKVYLPERVAWMFGSSWGVVPPAPHFEGGFLDLGNFNTVYMAKIRHAYLPDPRRMGGGRPAGMAQGSLPPPPAFLQWAMQAHPPTPTPDAVRRDRPSSDYDDTDLPYYPGPIPRYPSTDTAHSPVRF